MSLRIVAGAMGVLALALPAPAWASERFLTIEMCGGTSRPVPMDEGPSDPPGCHAVACLGSRTKANGESK